MNKTITAWALVLCLVLGCTACCAPDAPTSSAPIDTPAATPSISAPTTSAGTTETSATSPDTATATGGAVTTTTIVTTKPATTTTKVTATTTKATTTTKAAETLDDKLDNIFNAAATMLSYPFDDLRFGSFTELDATKAATCLVGSGLLLFSKSEGTETSEILYFPVEDVQRLSVQLFGKTFQWATVDSTYVKFDTKSNCIINIIPPAGGGDFYLYGGRYTALENNTYRATLYKTGWGAYNENNKPAGTELVDWIKGDNGYYNEIYATCDVTLRVVSNNIRIVGFGDVVDK